ncbi:MAG TPA: H-NS histone family protein [Bradyrhizobium sp.]|uniref:H-NS histone family protein n=1 Tax=Bradyrhizobium sp. TaxID=376 RepID=UPI002B48F9B7|nr:H-NS histone family protein [Bradyrhizobium sp.]HKO72028.1 H-NS histone family protein [Bradyrhizobium sp.]
MSRYERQHESSTLQQILAMASKDTTKIELKSLSIDELWALHEEIASILSANMRAKKASIEKLIDKLEGRALTRPRPYRRYRTVHPKFRNADPPHQTWSGRGRQPHWMRDLLARGKSLEDVRIRSD